MTSDPADVPPSVPSSEPGQDTSSSLPERQASRPESGVKFTRAAAVWTALFVGFLILILLLVFILQNTDTTTIHFLPWEWNLPLGVAILFAAVGGGLLTVAAGAARIFQLRRVAKKNFKSRP